jgi:hypothetical protein
LEDVALISDAGQKQWLFEWMGPGRAVDILDVDRAVVWAVARECATSPAVSIPLRWLFSAPSREKIERALESSWPHVREEAHARLAAGAASAG